METEDQRRKLKRWFYSALLPAMDTNGFIAVIGTVLHEDSLLRDLLRSKAWNARKYAILEDGESLWPEVYSVDAIEELKGEYADNGELGLFYREYMNEIVGEDSSFQRSDFKYVDERELYGRMESENFSTFLTVDPAFKTGSRHDYTAYCVASVDHKNELYIREVLRIRVDLPDLITFLFDLYEKYRPNKVGVQSIDWDRILMRPVNEEMRRRQTFFQVTRLQTYSKAKGMSSKENRILQLAPRYKQGLIKHVRKARGIDVLETELLSFPRSQFDDASDACSMLIPLIFPPMEKKDRLPSFMEKAFVDPISGY